MLIDNPIIVLLNTSGVFFLLFFSLAYYWFIKKNREIFLHISFAVISTIVAAAVLKELFQTPRPFATEDVQALVGFTQLSSFPSLHTAIAFALAVTVAFHERKFGVLLLVAAGLIGMGRVAANAHYPVDIAFGVLLGTLLATFFEQTHFSRRRSR